jgi:predicted RNase H-like nuclease
MQRLGQQQPNQQQPSDRATHSHLESAHAGCTPNTQASTAEPTGSPAAATTTTSVYTW